MESTVPGLPGAPGVDAAAVTGAQDSPEAPLPAARELETQSLEVGAIEVPPVPADFEWTLTEARVLAAWERAKAAAGPLGIPEDQIPELVFAEPREVAKAIQAENEALFGRLYGDTKGRSQARTLGRSMSQLLSAKYSWSENKVFVLPENHARNAELVGWTRLLDEDAFAALLVHELVHAADARVGWIQAAIDAVQDEGQARVLGAVIEGSAQHQSRQLCRKLNLEQGFLIFTASMTAPLVVEDDSNQAQRMLEEVARASIVSAYLDGERFTAALDEAEGQTARDRAFRNPPRDLLEIMNPGWYLAPETRPVAEFDLASGLAPFIEEFEANEALAVVRVQVSPAEILPLMTGLPRAERLELLSRLIGSEVVVLRDPEQAQSLSTLCLIQFADGPSARAFSGGMERAARYRDETMNSGPGRILTAEYTPFTLEGSTGIRMVKTVQVGDEQVRLRTLFLAHGSLYLEATDGLNLVDDAGLESWLSRSLAAARRSAASTPSSPR